MSDAEEKEPKVTKCSSCEKKVLCSWGPDPYAEEIHGVDTPSWQCSDCRYQSAMDI